MKPKIHTDDRLRGAADALYYEFWMFERLALGMASGIAGEGVINNALMESFVIHLRVLLDFFYTDKTEQDDIIAAHFFIDPEIWKKARPDKTPLLLEAEKRANKEVAHLTYTRLDKTPEQKNWEFLLILSDVNKVKEAFLNILPPRHLLGERWANFKI